MRSVKDGTKRITIRKGSRTYGLGNLKIQNSEDLNDEWMVVISSVTYTRLANVSRDDYTADGFHSLYDMREGLRKYYPDIEWEDEVTVIRFFFHVKPE